MTTANKNNDHAMIKNIIQQKDTTTKDITINNVLSEQQEEQKLAEEQRIQKKCDVTTITSNEYNRSR